METSADDSSSVRTTVDRAYGTADPGARRSHRQPGSPCDLVTVPARQGLEAVDILRRGADPEAVGPVLHDGACDTLGFLVPPGTADGLGRAGQRLYADERPRACASPPSRRSPAAAGCCRPAADARVTDPAVLRAALGEAARLIEAADNCR